MKQLHSKTVIFFILALSFSSPLFAIDGETADGDYIEVEDRTDYKKGDTVEVYDPKRDEYRDADVSDVHALPGGGEEVELEDERDGEIITIEQRGNY